MKISSYLKDKAYLLVCALLTAVIIILFLSAVGTNSQIIILITVIFFLFTAIVLITEFTRRNTFYSELENTMETLEKKYLLTEIISEPEFLDGKYLFQILREVDKSMCDHVNEYKNSELDYKNYIEMWVHEIKTPLAAGRLILSNNPSEISTSVEEELEKVEGFVEQALFYARSSTVEKDYMIKEMILGETIRKVIRRNSKEFIYNNIKIELQDIDVKVYSDSKWLEFIINQIISNALKYMPKDNGILTISAKEHANCTELIIHDNGIGIDEKDLPRIFDRGFTGSNGRNHEKSTGMGLFLCKTLCKKLYLDIKAESKEGTAIMITFPSSSTMLLK